MRLMNQACLIGAICLASANVPICAKATESIPALEKRLADFLSKEKGEIGGAQYNIDQRLRLKKCTEPVIFKTRRKDLVVINCVPQNWRVPVTLKRPSANRKTSSTKSLIIRRGQPVILVVEKNGFMISRQMQADRNGGLGDIIPARAGRRSSPILVKITGQGQVSLPSHSIN